jgi:hypothetical protein
MDEGGAVMQLMGIVKIVWVDAGAGDSWLDFTFDLEVGIRLANEWLWSDFWFGNWEIVVGERVGFLEKMKLIWIC